MNSVKKKRDNENTSSAQALPLSSWTENIAHQLSATLLQSTDQEIHSLKNGKIPNEVLYAWEAGKKLSTIDHQWIHPYTLLVNNGFLNMFLSAWPDFQYSAKKLRKCLWRMDTWVDIGTGNGVVSNMVAFPIVSQRATAILDREIKALKNKEFDDLPDSTKKPHFIACDLSKASLSLAEDLAKDHFHDLEKLFDLQYYQGTFQKLLAENNSKEPKLITMFNVLANFEYEDLKKILQDVSNAIKPWDVFIPSFFAMHDMEKTMAFGTPFYWLTKSLYDNKETRDWCVSAFCERYKVDPHTVTYNVDRKNNGRAYIDVSLSVPHGTHLHIPQSSGEEITLATQKDTFEVFKSYRMSKKLITELCHSLWFEIDYRLYDREGIHLAPVLYKP